ncbi:MAG: antibiotic biosynthesis monooxygenase [Polyangiales bacterium]
MTANTEVHVAIMRKVRVGREEDFETAVRAFFAEAERVPGMLDAHLIRPAHDSQREYGILRSFRSQQDKERFYGSDLYRRWNAQVAELVEGEVQKKQLHGLEAFFREPNGGPPAWKMALLTWVAVNPAVYLFGRGVPAVVGKLPGLAAMLLINACVVAALTWAFMPLLTKIAAPWLRNSARTKPRP